MAALPVVPAAVAAEPPGSAVSASPAGAAAATAADPVAGASAVSSSAASLEAVAIPSDVALDGVQLDASNLHVYHVALELHAQCSVLLAFTYRVVRDQLERASLSVLLNTAEAGGRRSRRDKARYYAHARGSATEVAALLDVLERRHLASPAAVRSARRLAIRCVQMLTKVHQKLST